MSTQKILLDPTSERSLPIRARVERLDTLANKKIGLLDISKARGDVFLDQLEARLREHGATVERFQKPTFAKPAPEDLRQQITIQCEAVVEALAD